MSTQIVNFDSLPCTFYSCQDSLEPLQICEIGFSIIPTTLSYIFATIDSITQSQELIALIQNTEELHLSLETHVLSNASVSGYDDVFEVIQDVIRISMSEIDRVQNNDINDTLVTSEFSIVKRKIDKYLSMFEMHNSDLIVKIILIEETVKKVDEYLRIFSDGRG
jgi:hypothetical protein